MDSSVKLYSLNYKEAKTYLFVLLFVCGNVALPQLCHLVPGGGLMWLPIYFFTLIASYKFGLRVGLLTAILSPIVNNLLFGMPPSDVLPHILIKSSLLAVAAAYAANRFKSISFVALVAVVMFYQVAGIAFEWLIDRDFFVAIQDFRLGIPGMLVQIFGGYFLLKIIARL